MNDQIHASAIALAQALCAHSKTHTEIMPSGSIHYSRCVCSDCGRQLAWLPKPETIERRRQNAAHVQTLLEDGRIQDWERDFLLGLTKTQYRLSPKQQLMLSGLIEKYILGKDIQNDSGKRDGALRQECAA